MYYAFLIIYHHFYVSNRIVNPKNRQVHGTRADHLPSSNFYNSEHNAQKTLFLDNGGFVPNISEEGCSNNFYDNIQTLDQHKNVDSNYHTNTQKNSDNNGRSLEGNNVANNQVRSGYCVSSPDGICLKEFRSLNSQENIAANIDNESVDERTIESFNNALSQQSILDSYSDDKSPIYSNNRSAFDTTAEDDVEGNIDKTDQNNGDKNITAEKNDKVCREINDIDLRDCLKTTEQGTESSSAHNVVTDSEYDYIAQNPTTTRNEDCLTDLQSDPFANKEEILELFRDLFRNDKELFGDEPKSNATPDNMEYIIEENYRTIVDHDFVHEEQKKAYCDHAALNNCSYGDWMFVRHRIRRDGMLSKFCYACRNCGFETYIWSEDTKKNRSYES